MEKVYLSNADVEGMLDDIVHGIKESDWQPDVVIGIGRGGLVPGVMLSHCLGVPMQSLDISLRDHTDITVSNCSMAEDAFGYIDINSRQGSPSDPAKRVNILVVDDINDTGATLQWIIDDWQHSCLSDDPAWKDVWGKNVRFATLINNEKSDFVAVDYYGRKVNKEKDPVWYCFPWENWFESQ